MNSGCTFQRVIHEVLRDLPYLFIYIDDILVGSRSLEEHEQHLREVFTRLRENCFISPIVVLSWPVGHVKYSLLYSKLVYTTLHCM